MAKSLARFHWQEVRQSQNQRSITNEEILEFHMRCRLFSVHGVLGQMKDEGSLSDQGKRSHPRTAAV